MTVAVAASAVTVAVAASASALVVVLFSAHPLQWWSFAVAASVAAIVVLICATMRSSIAFNMFTCTFAFAMLIFVGSVGE